MPGTLFHQNATAMCPHGGQTSVIPTNTRVLVSGMPVTLASDTCMVAGCAFTVGTKPQPCTTVRWLVPAARVMVMGQPVILNTSTSLCFSADQIPAGPAVVAATQTRALGE